MNIQQTAAVLALIALTDRRHIDEAVIRHWHDLIGDLPFHDACTAVKTHRRTTPEWLMPVHVRDGVHDAQDNREARFRRFPQPNTPSYDGDPADDRAYTEHCRRVALEHTLLRDAIRSGDIDEHAYDSYKTTGTWLTDWSSQRKAVTP